MADIVTFRFEDLDVRVEMDDASAPWWVLQDCCAILGLPQVHRAASRIDPDDRKKSTGIDSMGRPQEIWLINESGLYTLLLRSNKPEAKRFQRWVTKEVLPSIRKTGGYQVQPSAIEQYPELKAIVQLAQGLAETRQVAEEAQARAAAAEIRALQADNKADLAIATQHILTIRDYVHLHNLSHQISPAAQRDYGKYLTGYCLEHNIPVRAVPVADRPYASEHGYHVQVITDTLQNWLFRRVSQSSLHVLKPEDA
jgi:prophage antirepressor-like protein